MLSLAGPMLSRHKSWRTVSSSSILAACRANMRHDTPQIAIAEHLIFGSARSSSCGLQADVILRRYVERMLGEKDEQRRAELTKLMNQELQALKLADKHRVKKNPNTTSQS